MAMAENTDNGVLDHHDSDKRETVSKASEASKSWSERRSDNRSSARVNREILVSLQTCSLENNLARLEGLLAVCKSRTKSEKLEGLIAVLLSLTSREDGSEPSGFLEFDEAYHLYSGYHEIEPNRDNFRDSLIHPVHGLCVCVIWTEHLNRRFIVLKPHGTGLVNFLEAFVNNASEQFTDQRQYLNADIVHGIIESMDTEYDRMCVRALLACEKSRSQIYDLGLKPQDAVNTISKVLEASRETRNAKIAAEDMVNLRLRRKADLIQEEIKRTEEQLQMKKDILSEPRRKDLQEKQLVLEERLRDVKRLRDKNDKYAVQRFKQSVKRKADSLLDENRVKKRKLGGGAPRQVDTDEEEFLVKCIEEKTSAHGRRHDMVMYLNHRVKVSDFLSLTNYRRLKEGKRLIRSATTLYSRGRPKNIRSIAARRHIGRGLFCCKKPPKCEDSINECTHHQRAHKKNLFYEMGSLECKDRWKFNFIISQDDKAYVRAGTSVGLDKARNQKIIQPSDTGKGRSLPKYDFPEAKLNITPASHRIMTKECTLVNSEEKLTTREDQSIVFMRPKYYIGSSGSTWMNEQMEIRSMEPTLYEVESTTYSKPFRQVCSLAHDKIFHFKDATCKDDVMCVTNTEGCQFKQYERERLMNLKTFLHLTKTTAKEKKNELSPQEKAYTSELLDQLDEIDDTVNGMLVDLAELTGLKLWKMYTHLISQCDTLLSKITEMRLPPVRPIVCELTDAGPGVGIRNHDVRFRSAERIRIHNIDRMTRLHLARGDSSYNEVERTNAAIGNALVDGGGIKWDYHSPFEDLSPEEIQQLPLDDYTVRIENAMESNAFRVATDLACRVDDAPGPGGDFMKSYVTPKQDRQFFFDKPYLDRFTAASKGQKKMVPGHAYYTKLQQFIDDHYEIGDLYMEFLKFDCIKRLGHKCDFCCDRDWVSSPLQHVPSPMPDYTQLPNFHYIPVKNLPALDTEGSQREIDDYQPRVQIRRLFDAGEISSADLDKVGEFSKKYIVPEKVVLNYLNHLETLKTVRLKKQKKRNQANALDQPGQYDNHDWDTLYRNSELRKLKVSDLDMYIDRHKLTSERKMLKKDKLKIVEAHIGRQLCQTTLESLQVSHERDKEEEEDEEEDEIDEDSEPEDVDIVIGELGDTEESDSESDSSDVIENELFHVTRSGRQCTTWKSRNYVD
ncbi:uncharacterized protein [Ptychodera flava]|uniref:uncharacterized protein n=1 Tax=Ptychodera flava TaxID=63121 RepID=UPI00396A5351